MKSQNHITFQYHRILLGKITWQVIYSGNWSQPRWIARGIVLLIILDFKFPFLTVSFSSPQWGCPWLHIGYLLAGFVLHLIIPHCMYYLVTTFRLRSIPFPKMQEEVAESNINDTVTKQYRIILLLNIII